MLKMINKWSVSICIVFAASCHKNNNSSGDTGNSLLQYKWTLVSSTGTYPAAPYPFDSFYAPAIPSDSFTFTFGKNDTVYSYENVNAYYGVDTVFYKASSSSITFYINPKQNGILFETQDTLGHLHDTTVAQILALNDTLLVLSFPSIDPVTTSRDGTGSTIYYPGTLIDTLKR